MTGLYIWWPKQLTRKALDGHRVVSPNVHGPRPRLQLAQHDRILVPDSDPDHDGQRRGDVVTRGRTIWSIASPDRHCRSAAADPAGRPLEGKRAAGIPDNLDRLWARAEQQVPAWSVMSMRLPAREGAPVAFTITDGANWNAFARSNLTLNGASGEVVQWQPYKGNSLGQKARGWLRFAHTGELGGLPGQVIAGAGCLGGVFLVYTGLSLAFRRLWNWSLWRRLASTPRSTRQPSSGACASSNAAEPVLDYSE